MALDSTRTSTRGARESRQTGTKRKFVNEEARARQLGWFSLGLGLSQILMPGTLSHAIGLKKDHGVLMRLFGMREITSGLAILSQRRPAQWVWMRVVGDMMDLALLGGALLKPKVKRGRVAFATAAVAGVTACDYITARQLSTITGKAGDSVFVTRATTINRSPEELYSFWHNFQNLPRFMTNVESVQSIGQNRSHWVVKGPGGQRIEWNAEIVTDTPNELIAWRSTDGSQIENAGSVLFVPAAAGRGTQVIVELQYKPPAGGLGVSFAKLFGREPGMQMMEDLRRFKQLMETGEIPTTEGQPSGPRGVVSKALLELNTGWRK